jgi:predicted  nucleic acid-binding Zn-ribbon protein
VEQRVAKIEAELAVMSQSLVSIAKTLDKMSSIQIDTRLLEERINHLDKELQESFSRVHNRIEEEANARTWATRVVVGGVMVGVLTILFKGGIQ